MKAQSSVCAEPESRAAGRLVVALSIVIVMVDGFDLQAIGFVAPEIARDWSLDIAAFAPVFSAALAGTIAGAVGAGPAAQRLGLRSVLAISLVLFGGFTLLAAWVDTLMELALVRLLAGIGLGAAVPVVMSIVAANSPARLRATFMIMALVGQPIGAILGGSVAARFMPVYGWEFCFYLGGIIPLLLVVPVLLIRLRSAPELQNGPSQSGRLRDLFTRDLLPTTLLLWIAAFLAVTFIYLIVNWLPAFVRSEGQSLQSSVFAVSSFNFGGVITALLLGMMIDRVGPRTILPLAFLLAATGMAALDLVVGTPALFYPAAVLSGVGYGGSMCLGVLAVMLYPPQLSTAGVGCTLAVGRLGAVIAPLAAGMTLENGLRLGQLFYFAAGAAVLGAISILVLLRGAASPSSNSRF